MNQRVLITGGAGFIGRHVAQALLHRGYEVRVLDSLIEQVHQGRLPEDSVFQHVELRRADVRDKEAVLAALKGVDAVVHLAAEVGVGQSMYAIERYVSVNDCGSAVLLEALSESPVRRIVTASSMSIYGEGLYRTAAGETLETVERLLRPQEGWDPRGPDGKALIALPTPEWKRPSLMSVYALTKYAQERLTLTVAPAYAIEAVALRLFNVYGPGQALSNPYTGVLAIFAARLLNGQPPLIFEDGQQQRDFVHVEDVAEAFALALESADAPGQVFNIASGRAVTVEDVAHALAEAMDRPDIVPEITGKARIGDIRHCIADVAKARQGLGFSAQRSFEDSLGALAEWVSQQTAVDRVAEARGELETRGLVA